MVNGNLGRIKIKHELQNLKASGEQDLRDTVIWVLKQLKEATTTEIADKAERIPRDCIELVSSALISLLRDGRVNRTISKEKKAYVWSLTSLNESEVSENCSEPCCVRT
ncbi:MAG: hypothetical protein ACFFCZ_23605 [Promethearchaeota archaeon]